MSCVGWACMQYLGYIVAGSGVIVQLVHPGRQQRQAVLQQQEQKRGLPLQPLFSGPLPSHYAVVVPAGTDFQCHDELARTLT